MGIKRRTWVHQKGKGGHNGPRKKQKEDKKKGFSTEKFMECFQKGGELKRQNRLRKSVLHARQKCGPKRKKGKTKREINREAIKAPPVP